MDIHISEFAPIPGSRTSEGKASSPLILTNVVPKLVGTVRQLDGTGHIAACRS
jgi:hypothetical protein